MSNCGFCKKPVIKKSGTMGKYCNQACLGNFRKKYGIFSGSKNPNFRPIEERFFKKVEKTDSCWIWKGRTHKQGYGMFSAKPAHKNWVSHRASWEIHYGTIPNGLCVLHKCDVRSCVRPDHLFLGTYKDNAVDMYSKGRGRWQGGAGGVWAKKEIEKVA